MAHVEKLPLQELGMAFEELKPHFINSDTIYAGTSIVRGSQPLTDPADVQIDIAARLHDTSQLVA